MKCPECGAFMRQTHEPFMKGGDCWVEWECVNVNGSRYCWRADEGETIPAPEYNYLWYGYSKRELHELRQYDPAGAALIQQERGPGRKAGEGCKCKRCAATPPAAPRGEGE